MNRAPSRARPQDRLRRGESSAFRSRDRRRSRRGAGVLAGVLLAGMAGVLLTSGPSEAAEDRIYRAPAGHPEGDGAPYWDLLANCLGRYMAHARTGEDGADFQARLPALRDHLFRRLREDRNWTADGAPADVQAAVASGMRMETDLMREAGALDPNGVPDVSYIGWTIDLQASCERFMSEHEKVS